MIYHDNNALGKKGWRNILLRIGTIVKKELSDVVTNKAIILSLVVLGLTMVFEAIDSANYFLQFSKISISSIHPLLIAPGIASGISILGTIMAVAYGFNTVNGERNEGSLKVVLSYPLYRDEFILGKLVAGILTISIVTIGSLLLSLSIYLYYASLFLSIDMIIRFLLFTILTIIFLNGWLSISIFLSLIFRDSKMTLLVLLIFITFFSSGFLQVFAELLIHVLGVNQAIAANILNIFTNISPTDAYIYTSNILSSPIIFNYNASNYVSNSIFDAIITQMYSIVYLIIIPILSFLGSYIIFTKRDVF